MDDDLIERLFMLECRVTEGSGIASDFRVIELQIARAEDKVLRIARSSSTRSECSLWMTGEI